MKIPKLEKPYKGVYAIRVEIDKYLGDTDDVIIKYVPTAKYGDKWYADIFIEQKSQDGK